MVNMVNFFLGISLVMFQQLSWLKVVLLISFPSRIPERNKQAQYTTDSDFCLSAVYLFINVCVCVCVQTCTGALHAWYHDTHLEIRRWLPIFFFFNLRFSAARSYGCSSGGLGFGSQHTSGNLQTLPLTPVSGDSLCGLGSHFIHVVHKQTSRFTYIT